MGQSCSVKNVRAPLGAVARSWAGTLPRAEGCSNHGRSITVAPWTRGVRGGADGSSAPGSWARCGGSGSARGLLAAGAAVCGRRGLPSARSIRPAPCRCPEPRGWHSSALWPRSVRLRCRDLRTRAGKGYLGAELNVGPGPKIARKDWKGEIQVANPALPLWASGRSRAEKSPFIGDQDRFCTELCRGGRADAAWRFPVRRRQAGTRELSCWASAVPSLALGTGCTFLGGWHPALGSSVAVLQGPFFPQICCCNCLRIRTVGRAGKLIWFWSRLAERGEGGGLLSTGRPQSKLGSKVGAVSVAHLCFYTLPKQEKCFKIAGRYKPWPPGVEITSPPCHRAQGVLDLSRWPRAAILI